MLPLNFCGKELRLSLIANWRRHMPATLGSANAPGASKKHSWLSRTA
jgi:hypothetical protein